MNLKSIITHFKNQNVMVIGDIIVDEYIWGEVNRISPEAPVPVFEKTSEKTGCGGAANVAQNIASLGANVDLIGVIGKDRDGERIVQMLNSLGIRTTDVCMDVQRPTSKKTRVIVDAESTDYIQSITDNHEQHQQTQGHHLLRIDQESKQEISKKLREHLLHAVFSRIAVSDAIIFSDYDKGLLSGEFIKSVIKHAKSHDIPLIVDPKQSNFWSYEGVTVLTPNHKEAGIATQFRINDVSHLISIGEMILDRLSLSALLITRDADGMSLFQRDQDGILQVEHLPSIATDVVDVTGAGDTVAAVFTLALAVNDNCQSAAQLASIAGGIVVGKTGCATVTQDELTRNLVSISNKL